MNRQDSARQFDFGQNWKEFSQTALDDDRVEAARKEFDVLMGGIELRGKSFLDIGFGQGLSLLFSAQAGAKVVGCDVNYKCVDAVAETNKVVKYDELKAIKFVIGSILQEETIEELKEQNGAEGYDVVHSWGVLHHTGDMWRAIRNAAELVKPGGYFVIAIYNRHWSNLPWLWIKWLYVHSPRLIQRVMVRVLGPIIWVAKLVVAGERPGKMARGMDFYYNVVDWVGGYPYEYGSIAELSGPIQEMGFRLVRSVEATVPTGCNEFVFERVPS